MIDVRLDVHASVCVLVFFLMIRRPPRSTLDRSSAASDVYKRQEGLRVEVAAEPWMPVQGDHAGRQGAAKEGGVEMLSLIHISEPTRPY